jgi:hypothetical protein
VCLCVFVCVVERVGRGSAHWHGFSFLDARSLIVISSSRRSTFVPTRKMGMSGLPPVWCMISGPHFDSTLAADDGCTSEKQMMKTSVFG